MVKAGIIWATNYYRYYRMLYGHLYFLVLVAWASLVAQMIQNLPTIQESRVWSQGQEDPRRRKWQSTPVFLPGEFHRQRSLAGYPSRGSQWVGHDWATNTHTLDNNPIHTKINDCCCCFRSVAKPCPILCDPMDCRTPGFPVLRYLWVCSNSCLLNQRCHPTISSSVNPFSSCP